MNPVQHLAEEIREVFPSAEVDLDPAEKPNGTWFLDVRLGVYSITLEWQPHRGFGITSNADSGYGEGADEVYRDLPSARERLFMLLRSQAPTEPPAVLTLDMLRRSRRVTQANLAERLAVRQASIAKLEKRADIRLSTLQAFVSAMGGRLRIQASFPDGMERTLAFPGLDSAKLADPADTECDEPASDGS